MPKRPIKILVPDDLYEKIKREADSSDRSVSNYIVWLLKQDSAPKPASYPYPGKVKTHEDIMNEDINI